MVIWIDSLDYSNCPNHNRVFNWTSNLYSNEVASLDLISARDLMFNTVTFIVIFEAKGPVATLDKFLEFVFVVPRRTYNPVLTHVKAPLKRRMALPLQALHQASLLGRVIDDHQSDFT